MNEQHEPIPPDDLDRLLSNWAAGREASADHLSALQRRIVSQLAETPMFAVAPESQASGPSEGTRDRKRLLRSRSAWFLAVAASLLIIVGAKVWLSTDRMPGLPPAGQTARVEHGAPELPAGSESLPKEQLRATARLFAETQAVLGGQLQWLAETADQIELGMANGPAASSGQELLMVRVVVERRAAGAAEWKTVWATDVVALNQERVTLRPTVGTEPATLSLWAYRLPDGMVFVESELTLSGQQSPVQSDSSNILENNRTTEVGSVDADGAEYRILQTAAALNGDPG